MQREGGSTSSSSEVDRGKSVEACRLVGTRTAESPTLTIKSFGFRYGLAGDSDLVFDVRFLPNPYFVETLRPHTGLAPEVADYVLDRAEAREFLDRLSEMLRFLVPLYAAEGKAYVTVAFGCTGGRHRSVAIAEACARRLGEEGLSVIVRHRAIERTS